MQMLEKNEIKENFIFWLGEVHIVFAFLKIIRKYILVISNDQIFKEGPTTTGQIFEGKHMKRGMGDYLKGLFTYHCIK